MNTNSEAVFCMVAQEKPAVHVHYTKTIDVERYEHKRLLCRAIDSRSTPRGAGFIKLIIPMPFCCWVDTFAPKTSIHSLMGHLVGHVPAADGTAQGQRTVAVFVRIATEVLGAPRNVVRHTTVLVHAEGVVSPAHLAYAPRAGFGALAVPVLVEVGVGVTAPALPLKQRFKHGRRRPASEVQGHCRCRRTVID